MHEKQPTQVERPLLSLPTSPSAAVAADCVAKLLELAPVALAHLERMVSSKALHKGDETRLEAVKFILEVCLGQRGKR